MFKDITYESIQTNSRGTFLITIHRYRSGAHPYGDRSGTEILFNGKWYCGYDTRYEGIPTDKDEFIKVWDDFLSEEFGLKKEKEVSFKVEEVEDNDKR